jgi:hypothetical protein
MRYAGAHGGGVIVEVEDRRIGICKGCGNSVKEGKIKWTAFHHWRYAYQPKTVKENPILVYDNATEFGYCCHGVADSLRDILDVKDSERVINIMLTLPPDLKAKLYKIINGYIELDKHG